MLLYSFSIEIFQLIFLTICSRCSSFHDLKTLFHTEIIWGAKQVKIRGSQICTIRRIWQLFPTKLTDSFHCSCCSMRPCIVLMKPNDNWPLKRQGHHAQFCVLYSQKFPVIQKNVLYCNSSVYQNECFNWIHHFSYAHHYWLAWPVFILNTISTFFKQFSPFVNISLTKTHFFIHITSVNFALLSHPKFNDGPIFKPEVLFGLLPFWIASKEIFLWD